jgi:hypothetical protein
MNRMWNEATGAILERRAEAKRQCCRKCLNTCTPAVTLTFDGGTRRLHWCETHRDDSLSYVSQADIP